MNAMTENEQSANKADSHQVPNTFVPRLHEQSQQREVEQDAVATVTAKHKPSPMDLIAQAFSHIHETANEQQGYYFFELAPCTKATDDEDEYLTSHDLMR